VRGFTDALRSELIHDNSRVRLSMVQLSAFNTPQFDWGRTCWPRAPKPLGKIFQPEVAARGIYWAATHPRRELWVGWPAVLAIVGTRLVPGFLDWKLARQAYEGQQSNQPLSPARQDNLQQPVPGDHGPHGRFDPVARRWSAQLWVNTHQPLLAAMTGIGLLAILFALT
jgi:hypothetical protein